VRGILFNKLLVIIQKLYSRFIIFLLRMQPVIYGRNNASQRHKVINFVFIYEMRLGVPLDNMCKGDTL
jgi:hypothetical protein